MEHPAAQALPLEMKRTVNPRHKEAPQKHLQNCTFRHLAPLDSRTNRTQFLGFDTDGRPRCQGLERLQPAG